MKKRNIITALSLLSPLTPALRADSLFEEFRNMSEAMHQSFKRHLQEMDDMFASQSKFFAQTDTKTPSLEMGAKEDDTNIIVTLSFKNVSPKDGTCKIEFEDTANGSQWMRVLWQLSKTQEQESSIPSENKKSSKEKQPEEKEAKAVTTQNYSMNFTRTMLLPCPVDTEKAEIKQIDNQTVQVTLPKVNKRKTIHINL